MALAVIVTGNHCFVDDAIGRHTLGDLPLSTFTSFYWYRV